MDDPHQHTLAALYGGLWPVVGETLSRGGLMRLWTLHPMYLDPQGLVAVWRESLLAQKVLQGQTRGYRNHSQLIRFREHPDPQAAVADYLRGLYAEAVRRGYRFDASKILPVAGVAESIPETQGQLLYEWGHLLNKLRERSPSLHRVHRAVQHPRAHPLFEICPGPIADWERANPPN